MSCMGDAIAVPIAVNIIAINAMKTIASIIEMKLCGLNPSSNDNNKTTSPWIVATVAPPIVRPSIILNRDTGATSVSFKNPNCLSHMTSIPINVDEKSTLIAIIPGAKKLI